MLARFRPALLVALMSVLVFAAKPSYADIAGQPNSADVKTIDSCVVDARAAKTDPDVCIGRVSSACLEAASTTPTMETAAKTMEGCYDRELLVWQQALNRDYAQLTRLVTDDNAKQALASAEREFYIFELKQCTFDRIAHNDAPNALVAASRCNVRDIARQDLWLVNRIDSFKSH